MTSLKIQTKERCEMLDTRGLDKVLEEMVNTMEDGQLKDAFKIVLAETDEAVAQMYYNRLAECWGAKGNIDDIDPEYLLMGTIEQ